MKCMEINRKLKKLNKTNIEVTEIYTNKDALLDYYKIQNDLTSSSLINILKGKSSISLNN